MGIKRPTPEAGKRGKEAAAKALLLATAKEMGLPLPVFEHRFHPKRRWRLDVAWPDHKVGIEIMGGVYTMGRHTRGSGYEGDCYKLNAATTEGWRVLLYTYGMLDKEGLREVLATVRQLLG